MKSKSEIITTLAPLTVLIVKDNGRFMAHCPILDLVTEMNTAEESLDALLEMMSEYAHDYKKDLKRYYASPNRAHHKPYIEKILSCKNEWELKELIEIRHGHLHLR